MNSARVIEVIETEACRGKGTTDSPIRLVTQYWSKDGQLLAERDPFEKLEKLNKEGG